MKSYKGAGQKALNYFNTKVGKKLTKSKLTGKKKVRVSRAAKEKNLLLYNKHRVNRAASYLKGKATGNNLLKNNAKKSLKADKGYFKELGTRRRAEINNDSQMVRFDKMWRKTPQRRPKNRYE